MKMSKNIRLSKKVALNLICLFCDHIANQQDPKAWELLNSMRPRRNYTGLIAQHAPHVFVAHQGKLHFYWPPGRQLVERSAA